MPSELDSLRTRYKTNVNKVFFTYFAAVATREVSFGALFDSYLMNLGGEHGNVLVGSVESIRGLLQMVLAYPLGAASDRMPRVRFIQYNLPFWTLGFLLLMYGIQTDSETFIYAGMAVWAPCMQCFFSSSSAIVADSCTPDTRTETMANMSNIALLGGATGPFLQIVFLYGLGQSKWTMPVLHKVMAMGIIMWPFVFGGTAALEELPPMEKSSAKGRGRFLTSDLEKERGGLKVRWWLAIILQVSITFTSIGAGMTVKFFPLFFRFEYGFEPIDLCLLSFTYPLAMAVMQRVCLKVSVCLGRLQAMVIFHFLGTMCLFALAAAQSISVVLPLYYLRGALMNAKAPISAAVTMDLVTSDMRGRWSSIQSIAGFSWSGSAFIGGWVAQAHGYRASFVLTAVVYFFAGLMLLPLFFVFPSEREAEALHQKVTPAPTPRMYVTPGIQTGTLADAQVDLLEEAIDEVREGGKSDKTTPLLAT